MCVAGPEGMLKTIRLIIIVEPVLFGGLASLAWGHRENGTPPLQVMGILRLCCYDFLFLKTPIENMTLIHRIRQKLILVKKISNMV